MITVINNNSVFSDLCVLGSRDPLYITLAIGQGSGSMFVCYGLIRSQPCLSRNIVQVEDLDSTERGEGGFGSTGYHSNNLGNSEKPVTNGKRGNLEPDENQVKKMNVSGS